MAKFGITNYFQGGTKEQYDNTVKAVHPGGGSGLPPGQLYHAAGPTSDGFLVVVIWDSKATWEKFRDETLLPAFANTPDGLVGPPQITEFDVHNEMTE